MAVRQDEKERLERLWNQDHCVAFSQGIIVGKKVVITDGSLAGMESMIKKIDRHKRLAVVEMEFFGEVRKMTLGVEILQRVDG
jgi:transcriptional antiterminator NusG